MYGRSLHVPGSSCVPESNVGRDGQHSFAHYNRRRVAARNDVAVEYAVS